MDSADENKIMPTTPGLSWRSLQTAEPAILREEVRNP